MSEKNWVLVSDNNHWSLVEIELNCYRVYTQKQTVQSLCLHDYLDTISINDEACKPLKCNNKAERDIKQKELTAHNNFWSPECTLLLCRTPRKYLG